MKIDVTGQNIEITTAIRQYAAEKLERIQRHLDQPLDAHMVLRVEKERHHAEAKIPVNGSTLFADATSEDMYAAIDALADKLDRQALRYKDKNNDHHPREARKSEIHNQ
ncbi:ribosome hibernation-promoting factor, HPF/YfiA family [Candidatus Macondimonas diazotrophica]|jgi:putative sigma-54 modulation protein|uniref:Ribosome hibernation promoting factor n=1 Tax=Candidatus Macondimonas diazotrophica TaxID=2305248 RepID=A0A4Z0FB47_9GAMM|nr:ribosome-associated translation inhibitor RaiA [Candidatus Macondimonas diazotrophica]NCT99895.1 ribosome-associated translation inhibitor RaiA [Candidatus Macondimonas diazotrophica]TFZ83705.1 ribosome-associated translation inhibitor RaiA [Candidatus Macondimonas diazotrophica]HBG29720.1 ribosome-associated translation inhibitor RaiA [Gammaproteobacteria bacterium]HBG50190.1 ribosome-associated translation inhibitor RaiA [Gammaproteobacteria bacterium]